MSALCRYETFRSQSTTLQTNQPSSFVKMSYLLEVRDEFQIVGQHGQTVAGGHKEGMLPEDHVSVTVPVKRGTEAELTGPVIN